MLAVLQPRRLLAVLLAVAVLAAGLVATAPRTTRAAPDSGTRRVRVNVRAALSGAGSADIALVDQVTPRPSTGGKKMLCVDGEFYRRAGRDIAQNVTDRARAGLPVVFVGGDIDGLSLSLGGPCEGAAGTGAGPATPVGALKLTPGPDGQPVFNGFRVVGDSADIRSTMAGLRCWLQEVDQPRAIRANANWYPRAWFRLYSGDSLQPHGKMCIDRYYYRLANDGNAAYDYISAEIRYEQMSGQAAYRQNWKNEWAYQYCNVKTYQPKNLLLRYGPSSTVGQTSTSFSLGVTGSEKGVGLGATYSQGYSQPDVTCANSSDLGRGYTSHRWTIDRNSITAVTTFVADSSGFTYRHTASDGLASHYEKFQSQWRQYHWYGDKWHWSSWTRQVSGL